MRSIIDMAAERSAFIDQSASLNLFMESPTIPKLSSMYFHAWKKGLKTTYYLRSRPATEIAKTTVSTPCKPNLAISQQINWPALSKTLKPAKPANSEDRSCYLNLDWI